MRILGILVLTIGFLLIIFNGFDFQEEKQVARIGPVEINRKEDRHIDWPIWTGGIVVLAGIGLLIAARKK